VTESLRFTFRPIEEFAAVDEPGAEPLATTPDGGVLIPSEGIVLVYGDGGAGKTTLSLDMACSLAAGNSWLGLISAGRPLRIVMIENEGPRAEFRLKLRRKLAGRDFGGRLQVLEEPWAELSLSEPAHREALAEGLRDREADLLILGPLVSAGQFPLGGTPSEISAFEKDVRDMRKLVGRPVAMLFVHHENRAGQISGAWSRLPDTTIHVTAQGHGRIRLNWEKARHATDVHKTTTTLTWAEGGTYTLVEEAAEVTRETMAFDLIDAVGAKPGSSWRAIRDLTNGDGERVVRGRLHELMKVRDELIESGALVNTAKLPLFSLYPGGSEAGTVVEPGPADPAANGVEAVTVPGSLLIGTGEPEPSPAVPAREIFLEPLPDDASDFEREIRERMNSRRKEAT
jgi:hypothetical protein